MRDLVELMTRFKDPKPDGAPLSPSAKRVILQTGKLREFAATAVQPERRPSAALIGDLDKAVAAHSPAVQKVYAEGRELARQVVAGHDRKMAEATNDGDRATVEVERRQLRHYAAFDYHAVQEDILEMLKNED
jgi:hypothetical protein